MLIYIPEGSHYQVLATLDMVSGSDVQPKEYSAEFLKENAATVLNGTKEIPVLEFLGGRKSISLIPMIRK